MQSLSSKENYFIGLALANSSSYDSSICVLDRNSNIVLLDKLYFAQDIDFFFENSPYVLKSAVCATIPYDNKLLEGKWRIHSKNYKALGDNFKVNKNDWTNRISKRCSDTFKKLKEQNIKIIRADINQLRQAYGLCSHYLSRTSIDLLGYPESAESLIRAFSRFACLGDVICLGSATTARLWNRFAQYQVPTLYLRDLHTTGSDGALSTFLGNAADAATAYCLLGDLTLLRDINGAALLPQLPPGKRVVAVLNNDGAAAALSAAASDPEMERLLVQPQPFRMQEIARLWGAEYHAVYCEADLEILDTLEDNAFVLLELIPEGPMSC